MSVLTMPEPANWSTGRARVVWICGAVAVVLSGSVYWAVRAVLRGEYLTVIGLSGIVVFPLLMVMALALVMLGRTSLRGSFDSSGSTLRTDRTFEGCFYVGLVATIVGGAVLVRYLPTGTLAIPMSRGWQIFSPALVVVAIVFAVIGLVSAWRRGGLGYVKLTPAGVDIANILSTQSVRWDDIVGVADYSDVNTKTRKAIVLRLEDGVEKVVDGADFYAPRGAGLYWMVRHYWRHPDKRAELTDGRALERLSGQRFDVGE